MADVWSGCAVMLAIDFAWSTARRPVRLPAEDRLEPLGLWVALAKGLLTLAGFTLLWFPSTRAFALLALDPALAGATLLAARRNMLFVD